MKTLTKNMQLFAGFSTVYSLVFFHFLYLFIQEEDANTIYLVAILYALAMLITGMYLGYKEVKDRDPEMVGLNYHIITFITVNAIGVISILIKFGFANEALTSILLSLVLWGVGLFSHFYFVNRKKQEYKKL